MPIPPDDRTPQSELDMLEHAMSSMVQGVFSSMFRSIFEPSGMIENGRIIQQEGVAPQSNPEDEFGGSDFRRLARKSRQSRGLPDVDNDSPKDNGGHVVPFTQQPTSLLEIMLSEEQQQPTRTGTILDLLLPDNDRFFHRTTAATNDLFPRDEGEGAHGGMSSHFSFTSSSQRRVLRPDGTEESYITRTQNGVTETIKRITHPDGTVEETRESGGGRNHNPLLIHHPDNNVSNQPQPFPLPFEQQQQQQQQGQGGLLFKMWKRVFG